MKITKFPISVLYLKRSTLLLTMVYAPLAFGQTTKRDSLKNHDIEQVLVVGYGTQQKKKVTGAVSEVSLDKMTSRSFSSVGGVLQGKSPGVMVVNEGGDPTSTPTINIRGLGGINGETPLYIVDGVIFDAGRTPNINPNDIENISVLKDGSAAIYGARASGGVVLITTKRGKSGAVTADFDVKYGISNAWKLRKSLNAADFQDVMAQAYANNPGKGALPNAFSQTGYPDGRITRTDWINEIFRSGSIQEYNINVNGGAERSKFFLGMNHRSLEGILINTYAKRYNFRLNSEFKITDWLKIGENFNYNFANGNTADTNNGYTGAIVSAMYYPSNVPVYNPNGSFAGLPVSVAGSYGDVINPVAYLRRITYQNPSHEIVINPYVEISLLPELKFRSNFSQTINLSTSKNFTRRVLEVGKIFDFNRLAYSNGNFYSSLAEQILSYNKKIGHHTFDAVAGFSFQKNTTEGFSARGDDFKSEADFYQYLTNANTNKEVDSWKWETALQSYFGRFNYDFEGRYMISLIGRRDGTSMINSQNRYGNFYSVSGAWAINREAFLRDSSWLSMLKLRGSYGELGNLGGINVAAVNPTLSRDNNAIFGLNPQQNVAYFPTIYPNPNLKWGISINKNIGLDFGVLNNRLTLQAEYFIKDSKDQILAQPLPINAGYSTTYVNAGLFRDKGFELGLNYQSKPNKEFTYSFNANFNTLRSEVLQLITNQIILNDNVRGSLKPSRIVVGDPLYSFYGFKTAGIFQTQNEINSYKDANGALIQPDAKPGDIKFLKKEGNLGKLNNDDMVYLGSPYPKFGYNFSINMAWKGIDFNAFFQGVQGNKVFNGLKFITLNPGGTGQNYNMDREILNAWTPNNTNTNIPRVAIGDPTGNYSRVSDFYVEDASYLRLKNLTIGYTLPRAFYDKLNLNKVRIYMTADNLLTFTKYTGFDPEIGMATRGIDVGRYPQARTFIFGVTFGF